MPSSQKKTSRPENHEVANSLVATFMSEVKSSSGWTHAKIAEQLDPDEKYSLSDVMISQYLNGKKTMSAHRLLEFARRAEALGLKTPSVEGDLQWNRSFPAELLDEPSRNLNKYTKSDLRSRKAALEQLEKSIDRLVKFNWSDKNIIVSVILLTRKLISSDNLTHGGMVSPALMWEALGGNGTDYPDEAWLNWSIKSLDEHAEHLMAIDAVANADRKIKPTTRTTAKTKRRPQTPAKRFPAK